MKYLKKGIVFLLTLSLLFQFSLSQIQANQAESERYVVGEIVKSKRSVDDEPSGVIYGQAQMQYQFVLSKDGKRIQMGHGGQSGVAYLNTKEGSVYCLDPERLACASIGEQGSYDVVNYESSNAAQIGLIWYYGNVLHAHDSQFMDYVALTQIMIWEVLGWKAEIQSGFNNYSALRQEIELALNQHLVMPSWELVDSNVEDKTTINVDNLSFKLQANEYVVVKDKEGVFNQFFAHWDTIPNNIKVERVDTNSIKITALGNVNGVNLTYSKIAPEVIGHSYLLKPNANSGDCQTLLMPYVSKENSSSIQFKISSDNLPFEPVGSDATFPEFTKIDSESKKPIEGAEFTVRAAETMNEKMLRETRSCSIDDEDVETCSEWSESQVSKRIWAQNETLLDVVSDAMGQLDISELADLYRDKRDSYLINENEEIITLIDDIFPGGKFTYQETLTANPYYNENRNKKVPFKLDVNSESQKLVEKNTRQKGKIVLKKIDDDSFYLNHHNAYLPQGDGEFLGAEFSIHANKDIVLPWGDVLYKKGELIEVIKSDKFGIAESMELELGEYVIQEIKLPTGYWYHDYQKEGQKVVVDIEYTTQETSLQVITYDSNVTGSHSPFEEIETRVMNSSQVDKSLAYPNAIQKGHLTLTKHLEGKINDIETAPPMNKEPAEGIYFGVYLDSKQAFNHHELLPREFFMAKQLDGTLKENILSSATEDLTLGKVHERSLYMVLRTNEYGVASTLDPSTIAWVNLANNSTQGTSTHQPTPLPFGEYTVEELNTPQGYEPTSFRLSIDKRDEFDENRENKFEYLFSNLIIENKRTLQKVVIAKKDIESNQLIMDHDAIFKIWKWNVDEVIDEEKIVTEYDKELSQWKIGVENEGIIDYKLGKWINQIQSTTEGTVYLDRYQTTQGRIDLPQALMSGDYLLCEIMAPTGYALNDKPIPFSVIDKKNTTDIHKEPFIMVPLIDENGNEILDEHGEVITVAVPLRVTIFVEALNQAQKGTITIRKLGDVFDKFLLSKHSLGYDAYRPVWMIDALANGAIFEVYADGDIVVNRRIIYQDKELVDRLKISAMGEAGSIPLPLGNYTIKEVASKAGYATNQEVLHVKIEAAHQNQVLFPKFLTEVNKRLNPDISFTKYLETGSGLKKANQVYFGLYSNERLEGEEISKPIELEKESDASLFEVQLVGEDYLITNFLSDGSNQCWIPEQINGRDVVEIKSDAFRNKQLARVVIPSTIKKIGSHAFADNQLVRVEFHTTSPLAFEDEFVFANNPELLYLFVDEVSPLDSVKLGYDFLSHYDPLDGRTLGYPLIQIEYSFNNGFARNRGILPEERSFVEADTLLEVIEVMNGKGTVGSTLLDGDYYLKELQTLDNYILSETRYPFSYDEGKNIIINQNQMIVNQLKHREPVPSNPSSFDKIKLIIQKEFEGDPLNYEQSATFALYNEENQFIEEFTVTNSKTATFYRKLPVGKYTWKEISTSKDYVLDATPYEFIVERNTSEVLIYGNVFVNQLKKGSIRIEKLDLNTNLPLQGAEFALYDQDFNLLEKATSDSKGMLSFLDITYGDYYLKETVAPTGYLRNEQLFPISIQSDKEQIDLILYNDINLVFDYPETGRIIKPKKALQISSVVLSLYLLFIFLKKDE